MTRSYTIEHKPSLLPTKLDWTLHGTGEGRWSSDCFGQFRTEAEAIEAGELWIETGLPPAEQTRAIIRTLKAALAKAHGETA